MLEFSPSCKRSGRHIGTFAAALSFVAVTSVAAFGVSKERVVTATGSEHGAPGAFAPSIPVSRASAPDYVAGRLIIKLSPTLATRTRRTATSFGEPGLDRLGRRFGSRGLHKLFDGRRERLARGGPGPTLRAARAPVLAVAPKLDDVYVLDLSPSLDMEAVALEYEQVAGVEYAEPDRLASVNYLPNDPYLTSSGAWKQSFLDLWGHDLLNMQTAWDITDGSGILIAISDTGVDFTHPDIAGRAWVNGDEIPGNGVDDDANGYIDDINGWDFANEDSDPTDDHGHGTHVGGTAAATGDNGIGIAGVAYAAEVMAVKGLTAAGSGSITALAGTIVYASDNGADVLNASWGGFGSSDTVDDAIAVARAAGMVVVVAAGNSSWDASGFFPASNPQAITVSAFDSLDQPAFFTNFGHAIDVAAPGGGDTEPSNKYEPFRSVLSLLSSESNPSMAPSQLIVDDAYLRQAGTSMAAPHVAGAAALILANHPEYTIEQVRQVLRATADDVGDPGMDSFAGYGRVNVAAALAVDSVLDLDIASPATGDVVGGISIDIVGSADGPDFASYVVEYGEGEYPASWTQIGAVQTSPVVGGMLVNWDVSNVADGDYVVRVVGTTTLGDSFEDRSVVTVDRLFVTDPTSYSIHRGGGEQIGIHGSAYAPGFATYKVEFRTIEPDLTEGAWSSAGMTLAGGGTDPVFEGLLATFDTSVLPEARDIDLRVTVLGDAPTSDTFYHIVVDPDLKAGWPYLIPGLPQLFNRMEGHVTLADVDNNGTKEILAAYGDMVFVLNHDGTDYLGWPQVFVDFPDDQYNMYTDVAPAAADLDGDGDLEIVATDSEGIYIWHHDATPMSGWPRQFTSVLDPQGNTITGRPSGDFVLADMDGDTLPEIIFTLSRGLVVMDSAGNSLPGWPWQFKELPTNPWTPFPAVGDMTGDGIPEIAIFQDLGLSDPIYLYVFDAAGNVLENYPRRITRSHVRDAAPVLADLRGPDGVLEVVVNQSKAKKLRAYDWQRKNVRLKTKIPALTKKVTGAGRFKSRQEPLSAGDIDGDGLAEVFVGTYWPDPRRRCKGSYCTTTFLLGPFKGTHVLQAVSATTRALPGWPAVYEYTRGDNAHGPGSPAIGDLNGDGEQNVVVGSGMCWSAPNYEYHRCYTLHAYRPDGSYLPGFPKPTPAPGPTASLMPAIGDIDGDDLNELVFVDFDGRVLVYDIDGTPGAEQMQWPMFRANAAHTGAAAPLP